MENLILTTKEFEGRLNLSGFTNIEKSVASNDFDRIYPSEKFLVLEKSSVNSFMRDTQKLIKGIEMFEENPFKKAVGKKEVLEKAMSDLKELKRVRVQNSSNGEIREVYIKEKVEEINKGVENDIEKSHITDSFIYGPKTTMFKKKGKEIKEKLLLEKVRIEAEQVNLEQQLEDCYKDLTSIPTEKPNTYGVREKIDCPYKVFNWNQTYYSSTDNGYDRISMVGENGEDCQAAQSPEEAEMNEKYNNKVYAWLNNAVEIKTIGALVDNFKDETDYELTLEQVLSLF